MSNQDFKALESFLLRIPGIQGSIGKGDSHGMWWIKFTINIRHPLAWHVVQELGHVLNNISLAEKLPTVFKPVSPPPYMNGGPDECLSWVIEGKDIDFSPNSCAEWIRNRLPDPVEDAAQWYDENEE